MLKAKYQQGLRIVALLFLILTFSIYSTQAQVKAEKTLRILAIGNSFSEDALEHYLYGLASANDKKIVIGNLYIGGAPLSLHWENIEANVAAYDYRKITVDGKKEKRPKTTIEAALKDEEWDIISFQQASPLSGKIQSVMAHLPQLLEAVQKQMKAQHPHRNPNSIQYVYHQTWAYAPNASHPGFANYEKNQLQMYQEIVKTSQMVKALKGISFIVPAGTAIQNARQTELGNDLTRDGYHLDLNIGRYIAACTWYEKIFKQQVIGNPYKPEKVSRQEALIAQKAAHQAVKSPYKISKIQ